MVNSFEDVEQMFGCELRADWYLFRDKGHIPRPPPLGLIRTVFECTTLEVQCQNHPARCTCSFFLSLAKLQFNTPRAVAIAMLFLLAGHHLLFSEHYEFGKVLRERAYAHSG